MKKNTTGKKSKKKRGINKSPVEHVYGLSKETGDFPVVGIGASAGGLDALEQFFSNTAVDSGMAYVVIQHLDPNRQGILPELLQRVTLLKVLQAQDGIRVMPGCVYVIPSNKSMSILKGVLYLFTPKEKDGLRLPVDFFLRSLALDMGERAIGVILSGMGSDGASGMKAIKQQFGITAIQDPLTAKFDSMPRSAAETVVIDITAAPNELPAKLASFVPGAPGCRESLITQAKTANALEKIIILIRDSTGNDFSMYKNSMINRRIERRMVIHQLPDIDGYVRYLQENPAEVKLLFKELLIGVTSFFRDPKMWENLGKKYIPQLLRDNAGKKQLRAWVAACSSGEEAYSLAMVFKEALEASGKKQNMQLQIFATDIDGDAIEKARKGFYKENIILEVSPERLSRFFKPEKGGYLVNKEIREMIVFAPQNAVKDPPFTFLDIISCRNMMIYLENTLQKKLISSFRYSINLNGLMVLGSAEAIGDKDRVFSLMDAKNRIYKCLKKNDKDVFPYLEQASLTGGFTGGTVLTQGKTAVNVQSSAEQLILNHFSPAGVLTDKNGDIVHVMGRTGDYLEPAAGKTNWNIFAMIREAMRDEFIRAFRRALKLKKTVLLRGVNVDHYRPDVFVDIEIKPIENHKVLNGMLLVVFKETNNMAEGAISRGKKYGKGLKHKHGRNAAAPERPVESIKAYREKMRTAEEELRSANEELQSNNEELQSTNEELTTSKEETQSLNEELQTINAEIQSKLDIFERANNDMKNLLNSTEIAVLFIDREMRITRYTPMATKVFKLLPGDIGRPFTDLTNAMVYPEIIRDIGEVKLTNSVIEKDIPTGGEDWFRVRIMPYKTIDEFTDGFVLTFTVITASKHLEAALNETGRIFQSYMNSDGPAIISVSKDGVILGFNSVAEKSFGMKREEASGKDYFDLLVPEEVREKVRLGIKKVMETGLPVKFETGIKAADGSSPAFAWQASRMMDEKGVISGVIIAGLKGGQNEK